MKLLAGTVAALAFAGPTSAQTVSCGQVITSDVTLSNDLVDCPKDGLAIGRNGITVDLNGHTITGRFEGGDFCDPNCVYGRHGIDNSGGYDRITIRNGTINQFTYGVYFFRSHRSRVENVTYPGIGPQYYDRSGVTLISSDHNVIRNATIHRAEPGILLFDSDRNTIASSTSNGATSMRQGDGMLLAAGSDDNRIVDTELSGDWLALNVQDSNGNRFARISAGAYVGSNLYGSRNVVADSALGGGRRFALNIRGNRNRLERNNVTGSGGLFLEGNYNAIKHNTVLDTSFGAIVIRAGDRNLVRANIMPGGGDLVVVRVGASRTRVLDNYAARGGDGILVEAPGTIVGDNTANDNFNLGINAVVGVIDAGGNSASGNGNPLQCLNVFCQATAP